MTALGRIVDNKYRLLRFLGKGGMGTVWVAEHMELRSKVAIKFISTTNARAEQARRRFRREARAAAALRGPGVVQVFDYGIDQGDPYIVMELLKGETLAERMLREGCLTIQDTTEIAGQVANALARAHHEGIVHRDLKPQNIFLVRDEVSLTVKILDFGLAKVTDLQSTTVGDLTQPGNPLGTLQYMSPEQLSGGKVDARTDVWALAMVVFECLLGRLPFRDNKKSSMIPAIARGPLAPPSTFGDVPPGFDNWFARGTKRSMAQRESSVRALAQDLRRLTANLSGRCRLHAQASVPSLPSFNAYPSNPSTNDSLVHRPEASVPAAINGRRDMDHVALIARLSRTTGILWTRHRSEVGQWIRLTVHFDDEIRGHTTLAKVLRVSDAPNATRPSLWNYELTVRFAQPIEAVTGSLSPITADTG
ncbi:MAG TPA: serine/threonine-protein kinase [Polyangiaceae bacterium]